MNTRPLQVRPLTSTYDPSVLAALRTGPVVDVAGYLVRAWDALAALESGEDLIRNYGIARRRLAAILNSGYGEVRGDLRLAAHAETQSLDECLAWAWSNRAEISALREPVPSAAGTPAEEATATATVTAFLKQHRASQFHPAEPVSTPAPGPGQPWQARHDGQVRVIDHLCHRGEIAHFAADERYYVAVENVIECWRYVGHVPERVWRKPDGSLVRTWADYSAGVEAWAAESAQAAARESARLARANFLLHLAELSTPSTLDEGIDLVYETIDELLCAGRFDDVNELLTCVWVKLYDAAILVGFLSITWAARDQLNERDAFAESVRVHLEETETAETVARILQGLLR